MASLWDAPAVRSRVERLGPGSARCDCTSYSYLGLALVLFALGTAVTVLALGDVDGRLFSQLGHMWLVGPVFVCSGLMVAVKSMLYLRRKSVIHMLLHQRAIFRNLAAAQAEQAFANGQIPRTASTATLPPSYDALIGCGTPAGTPPQTPSSEPPPPTYEEAMFLIDDERLHTIMLMKLNESGSKDIGSVRYLCQNMETAKL